MFSPVQRYIRNNYFGDNVLAMHLRWDRINIFQESSIGRGPIKVIHFKKSYENYELNVRSTLYFL